MTSKFHRPAYSTSLAALAALLLATATTHADVLYSDDFTGNPDTGADGLNGESPDTGAGTWVAGSYFNADGSFLSGSGTLGSSATLAFTPADGLIYTLDARITINSGSWVAFGFAKGQSTGTSASNRFVTGSTPLGLAWSLLKPDGTGSALINGTASNVAWTSGFTSPTVDVRVVLDTTGGTGNWAATWYAKNTGDSSYTEVRVADSSFNEDINSVGFAVTGSASGSLLSFSLSDNNTGGGTTFADWIGGYSGLNGLTALNDDPDGDGIDNGVENFFGTAPNAFTPGLVASAAAGGTFTFTHPQGTLADDLTATYRWSKDLATFFPEGPGDGTTVTFSTSTDAGVTTVTATATGAIPDKFFVRVHVTQN